MAGVRYYGYYSPAFRGISRGKRKESEDDGVPCILEADKSSKEYRKNWARLIQKIGACPRLDRGRPIPKAHAPPAGYIRNPFSQLPINDDHLYPAKRGTIPGTPTYSRKDQEYGAEGTGVPG